MKLRITIISLVVLFVGVIAGCSKTEYVTITAAPALEIPSSTEVPVQSDVPLSTEDPSTAENFYDIQSEFCENAPWSKTLELLMTT